MIDGFLRQLIVVGHIFPECHPLIELDWATARPGYGNTYTYSLTRW